MVPLHAIDINVALPSPLVAEDQFLAAAERLMDEWLVMNGTSTESTASPASSEAQAPTLPSSP